MAFSEDDLVVLIETDGHFSAVGGDAMVLYEQVLEDGKFQPLRDGVWRFVFERDGGRLGSPQKDFIHYREMLYDLRQGRFRDHVVANALFLFDEDSASAKEQIRTRFPVMLAPIESFVRRMPLTKWQLTFGTNSS